jgi:hypothetical protein
LYLPRVCNVNTVIKISRKAVLNCADHRRKAAA